MEIVEEECIASWDDDEMDMTSEILACTDDGEITVKSNLTDVFYYFSPYLKKATRKKN